jgi:hypothetical protein
VARHLTAEQLKRLNALIESVRDGWAELRSVDPNDRDEWVRRRHKLAEWEAEIEDLWPARSEPL